MRAKWSRAARVTGWNEASRTDLSETDGDPRLVAKKRISFSYSRSSLPNVVVNERRDSLIHFKGASVDV
jgi:hypothetical protein